MIQRRPIGTLSSVRGRLRWRWLLACLGVSIVVPTVLGGVLWLLPEGRASELLGHEFAGWRRLLLASLVLLLIVPIQAAAEEFAFRGWLLQSVGAYVRSPWPGIAAASVIFAIAHGIGTGWGFVNLLLWGVVLGWLTIRTGGLEAAIVFHVCHQHAVLSRPSCHRTRRYPVGDGRCHDQCGVLRLADSCGTTAFAGNVRDWGLFLFLVA